MDRVIALIVRLIAALAGWAYVLPGVHYAQYEPGQKVKVLLVGYNGARNTGSDVRVAALADQVIQALGASNVEVSAMTLDPSSTAPYFEGKVRQIGFNTIFFGKLLKACSEHHVAVLCEGSTFKSKFADALTLYSCEAAGIMRAQGKPCIAYGGEIGFMAPYLARSVSDLCSDVFFMARSEASAEAARDLGLESFKGTDTAWTFDSSRGHDEAKALLLSGGWDGQRPLLGVAPINPYWWPVKPSLGKWAAKVLCKAPYEQFQKWYFFSWSESRSDRYRRYLNAMADATATFACERGFQPVVIGMEKLDEDACKRTARLLEDRLGCPVPVVLSKNENGYVIGEILRSLTLLATSRYHAEVLAMDAHVPAVAISMDERLDNLASEFSLPGELLLDADDEDLAPRLLVALDYAHGHAEEIAQAIQDGKVRMLELLDDMSHEFTERVEGYCRRSEHDARVGDSGVLPTRKAKAFAFAHRRLSDVLGPAFPQVGWSR